MNRGKSYAEEDDARISRILANQERLRAERLEAEGKCGCEHPLAECRPEICSHPFARDAMWGDR